MDHNVVVSLVTAVDGLLNETELEVVVYSGQLDLIVDTLGRSHCCYSDFLMLLCRKGQQMYQ